MLHNHNSNKPESSSSNGAESATTSSTNSSDLSETTSSSSSEEETNINLSENNIATIRNIDDYVSKTIEINKMGRSQIQASSSKYCDSTSSSTTKRYRNSPFGLKNHFLTLPEQIAMDDTMNHAKLNHHDQRDDSLTNIKHDIDCISSSELSESVSNWQGYKRHHQKTSRAMKNANNSKKHQNFTQQQPISMNHDLSKQHSDANNSLLDPGLLISDAGLDADKCNAKQQLNHQLNNNNYNNNPYYLNPSSFDDQHCNEILEHKPKSATDRFKSHHYKGSHSKTSSISEPASLLIRFSSIMYATFLVILGCIFHISELRQKSKNSSDHIYTIVVAFAGIVWLLFLQIDLLRYKRFASRYILVGSMFNSDLHHDNSKYKISSRHAFQQQQLANYYGNSGSKRASGSNYQHDQLNFMGPSGAIRSNRSNSSSAASLLNDRLSLNTEVIFKKTAYKMYEQERQRAAFGRESRLRRLAAYQQHQQHPHRLTDSPISEMSGPTNPISANFWSDEVKSSSSSSLNPVEPAYKFLHGKMGANFYLKCGMAAFCFGHVIHEGLRFGQQVYFFGTGNTHCRDSAALVAHLITPLYSFYQLFMMFKYSNVSSPNQLDSIYI